MLSPAEKISVGSLSITRDQVEYAGTIEAATALCESDDGSGVIGVAVLMDSAIAGFLLVKRGARAPDWVPGDAAVVSALRIDAAMQGRGIGTEAIRQLPALIRSEWPDTGSLVLAVDEGNEAAIRSYTKAGWRDQGLRVAGRIGWERRMELDLSN